MAVLTYEIVKYIRLSEQIADKIQTLIMDNDLAPGERLPSGRELAERFRVSRASIREAIKLLEERGLVEARVGQGIYVCVPGLSGISSSVEVASRMKECTIADLDAVRRCLELETACLAASQATTEDIAMMENCIKVMEANQENQEAYIDADMKFHSAIARATQNPLFLILTYPVLDLVRKYQPSPAGFTDRYQRAQVHHKSILECVKRKDSAGARIAMENHLDQVRKDLEKAGLGVGEQIRIGENIHERKRDSRD